MNGTTPAPVVVQDGIPLWLQIALALAAPSVALLVGVVSVLNQRRAIRQQGLALEHDQAMRLQEAQRAAIARMIRAMAIADSSNERFRAELNAGGTPLDKAWWLAEPVFANAEGVAGAYSELRMYLWPESRLFQLAQSAVSAALDLAIDLKVIHEQGSDSVEAFEAVERHGESMQGSMEAFVDEARSFANGGPLLDVRPDPTPLAQ